ncbi:lipopolysaccharide biosynthesis protein [Nostocoides sp. HKS02]|uniref:lipopolysaccharide biosynthesis protein n=1 Tax=Nostocoides sp. HKS02 TaxID=1813880 RepID=UPI0012B4BBD1|nr:oligosaccharide flippase family protein [Tetrasphaera sp. HKS02]QGN57954.1 oligosaccharide flippase family protein [Tetrasphaera sp. HKS02]
MIAISMSSVTTLIGALGLTSTLRTLFAHADHRLTVEAFAPLGARLLLSAGVPLAAIGAVGVGLVSGTRNPALLATTAAFSITALGAALGRETLHGLGHHAAAVASDLFPPLLQLVGSTLLWRAGDLSVTSVLALGALGYAGQICFCLWKSGFAWSRRQATSWGQLRGLIIISLPAMLAGVGNIVMWKGDRLILGTVSTNAEVGIYGTAASLADLAWIVPSAASAILIRRVASVGNLSSLSHWRRRYVSITAVLAIGAAGISFLVMHYVLGGEFVRGLPAAYLLCGASVLLASSNIDLSACQGLGDFRSGSIVTSTGACAMVIAAIPLSLPVRGHRLCERQRLGICRHGHIRASARSGPHSAVAPGPRRAWPRGMKISSSRAATQHSETAV